MDELAEVAYTLALGAGAQAPPRSHRAVYAAAVAARLAVAPGDPTREVRDGVVIMVYPAQGRYTLEPTYLHPRGLADARHTHLAWHYTDYLDRALSTGEATARSRRAEARRRARMVDLWLAGERPRHYPPAGSGAVSCPFGTSETPWNAQPKAQRPQRIETDLAAYFGAEMLRQVAAYRRALREDEDAPPATHDGRHGRPCRRCVAALAAQARGTRLPRAGYQRAG